MYPTYSRSGVAVAVVVAALIGVSFGAWAARRSDFLIPIATILVSVVVALVQYAQWRTANQNVVVNLYDRRLRTFTAIEDAVAEVARTAKCTPDNHRSFMNACADARFLFGNDVLDYLTSLREDLSFLVVYTDDVLNQSPDRSSLIEKKYQKLERLMTFFREAPQKFAPYISLTQRLTPFWRPW